MNSYIIISLFVVSWSLSTVLGQEIGQIIDGPCSLFEVNNQQPFLKKLLKGTWYVYASYDYLDIVGLDCLVAFYRLTPDGHVMNNEGGKNLMTNGRRTFQSTFKFDKPGIGYYTYQSVLHWLNKMWNECGIKMNENKLEKKMYEINIGHFVSHKPSTKGSLSQGVDIPVADYIHYYIEFSCVDLSGGKSDCYIGIFTRLPFPSAIIVSKINAFLDTHHIDKTKLRYIVHDKIRCST